MVCVCVYTEQRADCLLGSILPFYLMKFPLYPPRVYNDAFFPVMSVTLITPKLCLIRNKTSLVYCFQISGIGKDKMTIFMLWSYTGLSVLNLQRPDSFPYNSNNFINLLTVLNMS